MAAGRDVLGLMLLTNAQAVAAVLRDPEGSAAFSPLAALAATRTLALVVEDTMRALVAKARAAGATWQDIGDVLGTTRQAAYQRFGSRGVEGEPVDRALPDAHERAIAAFAKYASGDWSLRDDFDDVMKDRLSEDLLTSAWAQVSSAVGKFERLGEPTVRSLQGHTVVDVPMTFEQGEMKGRVAFDADGKIAGFFVLDPNVA